MPGMAAAPSIFQNIVLSPELFNVHYLEWHVPTKGISISDYAKEMCDYIKEENPVLIGVSFGGMLVQEMAKHIKTRQVIIISSVKLQKELPKRMQFAKYTKLMLLLIGKKVNLFLT